MNYRQITAFIMTILVLVTAVSCSGNKTKDTGNPIRIYHTSYDTLTQEAIKLFRENYKNKVKESIFGNMDEYHVQITSELLNGGGPDVIIIDPSFQGTEKLVRDGAFMDIDGLAGSKQGFTMLGCNEKVMNGMLYDGKRYLVPISYSVHALVTTKKILETGNLSLNENKLSISSLLEAVGKKSGNSPIKYSLGSLFSFTDMLTGNGINGRDICSGSGGLDDKTFGDMLKSYKELYKAAYKEAGGPDRLLQDKTCAFVCADDASNPGALLKDYSDGRYGNEVLKTYNIESSKGGVYAKPQMLAGINKNCKNPEAAINFIKILLDKKIQSGEAVLYTPVNKDAYGAKIGGYKEDGKTTDMASAVEALGNNITGSAYIDYDIGKIINDGVKEYLDGGKTAEETAAGIRSAIKEYLDAESAAKPASTSTDQSGSSNGTDNSGGPGSTSDTNSSSGSGSESENRLSMYLYDRSSEAADAIRRYNLFSLGAEIESEITKNKEEFTNKLTASILAGNGPDIIVADPGLIPSVSNMAKSGIFTDLNPLIKRNPEFKPDDYYGPVYDSGVYGGKRYYIPYRFTLPVLFTTDEVLKQNNIQVDENNWTWDKVLEIVNQLEEESGGEGKFLFSELDFNDMLRSTDSFINYDRKKSSFNTKEFIELLNIFKQIHPYVCTQEEYEKYGDNLTFLQSGKGIFLKDEGSFVQSFGNNSIFLYTMKQEARFLPMLSVKSMRRVVDANEIVGINEGCKNKEDAFKYIKVLLDKSLSDPLYRSFPVSKKAVHDIEDSFITRGTEAAYIQDNSGTQIPGVPILQSHVDKLNNWLLNIDRCNTADTSINDIISEQVKGYLDGQQTAEQTAKTIDEKVSVFLNE